MLARAIDSLCLHALVSPAVGWVVRTVIVLASRAASPRGATAGGRAGAMVLVRVR